MSKKSYYELLKDPRWQRKRLKILDRDDWTCQYCGDATSTLNIHHKFYVNGYMPWEYPDYSLITFCENCHKDHKEDNNTRLSFLISLYFEHESKLDETYKERILETASAFNPFKDTIPSLSILEEAIINNLKHSELESFMSFCCNEFFNSGRKIWNSRNTAKYKDYLEYKEKTK